MNDKAEADLGAAARALIRGRGVASLATGRAEDGWPYVSLVLVATDPAGAPVLLISRLAEHWRNLEKDPRCALLFDGTKDEEDRLAGSRLSLLGTAEPAEQTEVRARYLARHPSASVYVDFADFGFFRLRPARGHLVAGFGRIRWIEAGTLAVPAPAALSAAEPDILAHMNQDHKDAIRLYATRLLGLDGGQDWRMTGIDWEGCDLASETETARLAFAKPIGNAEEARAELVRLAKAARG